MIMNRSEGRGVAAARPGGAQGFLAERYRVTCECVAE